MGFNSLHTDFLAHWCRTFFRGWRRQKCQHCLLEQPPTARPCGHPQHNLNPWTKQPPLLLQWWWRWVRKDSSGKKLITWNLNVFSCAYPLARTIWRKNTRDGHKLGRANSCCNYSSFTSPFTLPHCKGACNILPAYGLHQTSHSCQQYSVVLKLEIKAYAWAHAYTHTPQISFSSPLLPWQFSLPESTSVFFLFLPITGHANMLQEPAGG